MSLPERLPVFLLVDRPKHPFVSGTDTLYVFVNKLDAVLLSLLMRDFDPAWTDSQLLNHSIHFPGIKRRYQESELKIFLCKGFLNLPIENGVQWVKLPSEKLLVSPSLKEFSLEAVEQGLDVNNYLTDITHREIRDQMLAQLNTTNLMAFDDLKPYAATIIADMKKYQVMVVENDPRLTNSFFFAGEPKNGVGTLLA
jgi:hypothetical protein